MAPVTRQRDRLVRSIAQNQLLTSAALLLLAAFSLVVTPESLSRPAFFGGIALAFVVTGLAVLVPWTEANKRWAIILPILDIFAIIGVREGETQLGAGLFLVFPIIWMSRNFRLSGAVGGVLLATALLWTTWAFSDSTLAITDFSSLVLLPLTLSFIATTIYATSRRTTGQRVLLRQQASLTEAAFARARRQERSLDEILNAVEFGVIAFNRQGSVTLINDAHRASLVEFGAPRAAIVHPTAYQSDRITPFPESSRPFSRALNGQSFENLTIWVGEPGTRQVAFSVTSRSLTTQSGEPDGGVIVLRDVTAELEAIQARDDLVASVSHELRTPLTSILGYLELALDDDELQPDTHRMVDIAHRNSERLLSLVTDLLTAASDADKRMPLKFETCDIATIVRQAVDDQRPVAANRGITLTAVAEETTITSADPLRIRQVVDNLLSNAIKYNRDGGRVVVSASSGVDDVIVNVADTGVGLTPEEQSHLFDRFYRTESARASSTQGTGLGMGITRDIVRQHGGELTVQSERGVGSTFVMTLPGLPESP